MSIFEKIKSDHLAARKKQDSLVCKVLSTLIGELQGKAVMTENGKVVSDELVIKTVKSWVKTYEDMIAMGRDDVRELSIVECAVITPYLPKQLTEDELRVIIVHMIDKGHTLPEIMKLLKERYPGLYDGKLASSFVKELI
jgi:uncharacterized protein